jgi:hypothetical protein
VAKGVGAALAWSRCGGGIHSVSPLARFRVTETAELRRAATCAFVPGSVLSLQLAPNFRVVCSTDAVRPRYGYKSPPGAGVTPG